MADYDNFGIALPQDSDIRERFDDYFDDGGAYSRSEHGRQALELYLAVHRAYDAAERAKPANSHQLRADVRQAILDHAELEAARELDTALDRARDE